MRFTGSSPLSNSTEQRRTGMGLGQRGQEVGKEGHSGSGLRVGLCRWDREVCTSEWMISRSGRILLM